MEKEIRQGGGRRYIVVFAVFMVYAVFNVAWVTTGVLGPSINKELGLTIQQTTLLVDIILFAKIFGSLFAGFLIYRFGLKWGYVIGCLLIGAGVLHQVFDTYASIILVRFFVGLGSAVALIGLIPVAQQYFSGKALSFVIALNMTSGSIGAGLGILFTPFVVKAFSGDWRLILSLYGLLNLVFVTLWILFQKDPPKPPEEKIKKGESNISKIMGIPQIIEALSSRVLWGMIIFYIGPLAFLNSTYSHFPLFFEGYSRLTQQDKETLIVWVPAIISLVLCVSPYLGAFLKAQGLYFKNALISCSIVMALSVIVFTVSTSFWILVTTAVVGGFAFGVFCPFFFALPSEMKDTTITKTSYILSCFWAFSFLLSFANQQFMGFLVDKFKTYDFSFYWLIGCLVIFSAISLSVIFPPKDYFASTQESQ